MQQEVIFALNENQSGVVVFVCVFFFLFFFFFLGALLTLFTGCSTSLVTKKETAESKRTVYPGY